MMTLENLQFAKAMPRIEAFNTLRGKVIKGNNYSQFNLCDYTGDDGMDVIDSRMLLCMQLGIDLDRLIMPRQTHTANVAVRDRSFITDSIGTDGHRYLSLHHRQNGDPLSYTQETYASIPLEELDSMTEGDSITLSIHTFKGIKTWNFKR